MAATDLSEQLGIGAVGVRQHLALLEADGLVSAVGQRRGIGRPSTLYALTDAAAEQFPRHYDTLALDALSFVERLGGAAALDALFAERRGRLEQEYRSRLTANDPSQRVAQLAEALNDHGYMCEVTQAANGDILLTERNCPVGCAARGYSGLCQHELTLYEDLLQTTLVCEERIATGGTCCRYRIRLTDS